MVDVFEKGYGAALKGGIATTRGEFIVMGDADGSYNFGDIPKFVAKLEEGYDLVMGNLFFGWHRAGGDAVASSVDRQSGVVGDWAVVLSICGEGFSRWGARVSGWGQSGGPVRNKLIRRADPPAARR